MNYELGINLRIVATVLLFAVGNALSGGLDDLVECSPRDGLLHFFDKIKSSQPVTIAYIGGSITAQEGWRVGTYEYFVKKYPDVKFTQVHAAIPGTGSNLGASRLQRDVLSHKPDLVFVEFAVNDGDGTYSQKTYEGIVRQIFTADIDTDICFVYTIHYSQFEKCLFKGVYQPSAQEMEVVAEYYGVPTVHLALEAAKLLCDDKLLIKAPLSTKGKIAFSPDGVHPYPETGHKLYTQAVVRSLDSIRKVSVSSKRALPKPLHEDNWQKANLVSLNQIEKSGDWKLLTTGENEVMAKFESFMPQIWVAKNAGSSLSFSFKGRAVGIYGLKGPDVGMLKIEIDEESPKLVTFFDSYCTTGRYKLKTIILADNLSDTVHKVRISVDDSMPDKASILGKGNEYVDSDEFRCKKAYIGDIIINGELTELE